MNELQQLEFEYYQLLEKQSFVKNDLDYAVFDRYRPFLDGLSRVNNSGVTVFDMYRKEHIYTSYNFSELFGYDLEAVNMQGNSYFNSRVHPDDYIQMLRNGIAVMKLFYQLPAGDCFNYKLVNEYRIFGYNERLIRVIEQHQVLELDKHGNVWFALGIIDVSPDQSDYHGIRSQVFNFKTGEIISTAPEKVSLTQLTRREKEIFQFVKEGLLSKEISERLSISVHTVNTHRQRILEKLGANNSLEAIACASKLGLAV